MIPLTVTREEMALARSWVQAEVDAALAGMKKKPNITIGTMIETPRAALRADEIAEVADFFSFGTNDLTQLTFGFSRDDVESRMMPQYLEQGLLKRNPFETIDQTGVGDLVRIGAERGRSDQARPEARRVRRARRRPGVDRPVLQRRARLRVVLAVPRPDRPARRRPRRSSPPGDMKSRSERATVDSRRCVAAAAGDGNFVDLDVHLWQWGVLLGVIVALLLVDLLVFHREAPRGQTRRRRRSSRPSGSSIGLAFTVVIWWWFGAQASRRVHLGLPDREEPQRRQRLRVGADHELLPGAAASTSTGCCSGASSVRSVLRAIFIFAGVALIEQFDWVLYLFGAFLLYTAAQAGVRQRRAASIRRELGS